MALSLYRYFRCEIAVADDSSLNNPIFGPRHFFAEQVKDLQAYTAIHRVGPSDSEFVFPISSNVTASYAWALFSDYPVQYKVISGGTALQTLKTNSVAQVNVGSPVPDQCCIVITGPLLNNYLGVVPIAGASQTANVRLVVTGDPINAYT